MANDAVSVDTAALVREWRAMDGDSLWIVFKTRQEPGPAMAAFRRAAMAVEQSLSDETPDEPPQVAASSFGVSRLGPVAFLGICDSADALKRWAMGVAAELEGQGCSGRLTQVRPEFTPYDGPGYHVDCVTAGLVLPINVSVLSKREDGSLDRWAVDDDLTGEMVGEILDFCLPEGGDVFFKHRLIQFRIDTADAGELLRQAIAHGPSVSVTWPSAHGAIRRAVLDHDGRTFFEWRDESVPDSNLAQALSRILVAHAPHLEYGFVRQSWSPAYGWDDVVDRRPPRLPRVPVTYSRRPPHLERSLVPDACGIQLLSRAHLDRGPDLRDWQVEEVAPERYLVISSQLEGWFGPEAPNEAILRKARQDFEAVIMDEGDYDRARAEWPTY